MKLSRERARAEREMIDDLETVGVTVKRDPEREQDQELRTRRFDHQQARLSERRGTIYVERQPLVNDREHFGAAPRPIEPSKRLWRAKDIVL